MPCLPRWGRAHYERQRRLRISRSVRSDAVRRYVSLQWPPREIHSGCASVAPPAPLGLGLRINECGVHAPRAAWLIAVALLAPLGPGSGTPLPENSTAPHDALPEMPLLWQEDDDAGKGGRVGRSDPQQGPQVRCLLYLPAGRAHSFANICEFSLDNSPK
jgi:hypothetical protein